MQAKQNKEYIHCFPPTSIPLAISRKVGKSYLGRLVVKLKCPCFFLLSLSFYQWTQCHRVWNNPFINWNQFSWMCSLTAPWASPVLKHLCIKNFSQYLSFGAASGNCPLSICSALLRKASSSILPLPS